MKGIAICGDLLRLVTLRRTLSTPAAASKAQIASTSAMIKVNPISRRQVVLPAFFFQSQNQSIVFNLPIVIRGHRCEPFLGSKVLYNLLFVVRPHVSTCEKKEPASTYSIRVSPHWDDRCTPLFRKVLS